MRTLLHFTMLIERLRTTLRADDAHIKSEGTLAVALRSVFLFTMLLQFTLLCERTLLQFTMLFERLDARKSGTFSCSSQCLSIYHIAAISTFNARTGAALRVREHKSDTSS